MFNAGESIIPLIVIPALVSLFVAFVILQRRSAARKNASTRNVEVEDYYDEECMGVVELTSGRKHVFPNTLIQQIDVKLEGQASQVQVAVYVTAEFNYAEFHFSEQQVAAFLATMGRALPDFRLASARQALSHAISTGALSTIYVSPEYERDIAGSPSEA